MKESVYCVALYSMLKHYIVSCNPLNCNFHDCFSTDPALLYKLCVWHPCLPTFERKKKAKIIHPPTCLQSIICTLTERPVSIENLNLCKKVRCDNVLSFHEDDFRKLFAIDATENNKTMCASYAGRKVKTELTVSFKASKLQIKRAQLFPFRYLGCNQTAPKSNSL